MPHRRLIGLMALATFVAALVPRSVAYASSSAAWRIYLPFAFGPACNFEPITQGPTPGPLPTLAARRWQHVRPANEVQAIARDERTGDIWTVGFHGVARHSRDGTSATSYNDADGLSISVIRGVAVAPNGTVWVGGDDRIARLRSDGRWMTIEAPVQVKHIVADRTGGVWVGSETGVARLGPECGWEYPVRGFPLHPRSLVTAMLATPDGDVWLATAAQRIHEGPSDVDIEAAVAVHHEAGQWDTYGAADGLRLDLGRVVDLAYSPNGHVWALTDGRERGGDGKDRVVIDVLGDHDRWAPAPLSGFEYDPPSSVEWDARGRPWFGGGFEIYVPDDDHPGHWTVDRPPLDDPLRMSGVEYGIAGLLVDADGVAWVGAMVSPFDDNLFRRLPNGQWRDERIVGPRYADFVTADASGVWMGLYRRDADGAWTWSGAGFPQSATATYLNDLTVVPDGLWCASTAGLVHRASDGTWTHFTQPNALGGRDISAVVAATDGSVWAVTASNTPGPSVTRHRPDGRWEPYSTATGLPTGQVLGVATGGGGAVWVGLESGATRHIASLQPDGTWTDLALPSAIATGGIAAMAGDAAGALWLFSTEHGLVSRAADGTWDAFDGQPVIDLNPGLRDDRPHVPVLAIAPDGSAWIGGRSGEVRVRRADGEWRSLMLLDRSSVRDIAFGADGRAWMTMVDGSSPRVVEVGE
ncbi:MAG: hypothetical protein ABI780_11570 [Ardenticatenales bacterium]